MNRIAFFLLATVMLFSVSSCKKFGRGVTSLGNENDTLSYCFGYNIARSFSQQKNMLNPAMLGKALRDYKAGTPLLNEAQAGAVLDAFGAKMQAGLIKKDTKGEWLIVGSEDAIATDIDSVSYAMGCQLSQSFGKDGMEINSDALEQAIWDFKEKKTLLKENEVRAKLEAFSKIAQDKQNAEMRKQGEGNLAKANEFLEQNKTKPGVKVHESGLQYKVLRDGTGKSPTLKDQVTIHYRGTLTNGEEFDSSIKRGEPATFPLSNLIQAWQIALPMMKEGAKWEIYVPPSIGYGEMGSPPTIGPNAALIFEIELFKVVAGPPAPAPGH